MAAYAGLSLAASTAAALVVLRAPRWAYPSALAGWLVAIPLLTGLGAPANWPGAVRLGAESLIGSGSPTAAELPGAETIVLWMAGAWWIAAALAAAWRQRVLALLFALAPWLVAVCARYGGDPAWEGGAVVATSAWWLLDRGEVVARRVAAAAAVAGVALAVIATPSGDWLGTSSDSSAGQRDWSFDPAHAYGRLRGDRRGTVLMRVRPRWPSYWRMQALDIVDAGGWKGSLRPSPRLPEPKARTQEAIVEIRALRTPYAVGPGRIESVPSGSARAVPFSSGSWRLSQTLGSGDKYRVRAASVDPPRAQLERAAPPADPRARHYMIIGAPGGPAATPAPFGVPRDRTADAALRANGYGRPLSLATRLSAGAGSQAEVVRRVDAFLAKYRYSEDAADHARPLDAFLFEDRKGYCQHFAGSAALLLRLAGIPARVVSGFSRGDPGSDGAWVVRDRHAHAWVEVWYQGLGWVAFDPTPPSTEESPLHSAAALAPLLGLSLLPGCMLLARRRRRGTGADLLVRLARLTDDVATLRESADVLRRTVGPRTAGVALAAERARYGEPGALPPRRLTVARALWDDRGPIRAAGLLAGAVRRTAR